MKSLVIAAVSIPLATGVLAAPATAQSSPQQMLQGLLSGNQGQDQAVREAYERGYRAGRQDEARMASGNGRSSRYDNGGSSNDRGGDYQPSRSGSGSGSGYAR